METARLIKGQPGPVLALGDLAYRSGSIAEYDHCYHPAWGSFKDRTFPTLGNHETKFLGLGYATYWSEHFANRLYYSFDYKGWHIVSLNSEIDSGPASAQSKWLSHDLRRTDSRCVLAYFHRPAFSSQARPGSEGARHLFDMLYRAGASVVLSGHNHFYERTAPLSPLGSIEPQQGLRQFVVGTGGSELKPARKARPFTKKIVANHWGVLKIALYAEHYSWEFVAAPGGTVLDSGQATCVERKDQTGRRDEGPPHRR